MEFARSLDGGSKEKTIIVDRQVSGTFHKLTHSHARARVHAVTHPPHTSTQHTHAHAHARELSSTSSQANGMFSPRAPLRFFFFFFWNVCNNAVLSQSGPTYTLFVVIPQGAGIACWLERRARDRKVASSNPGRGGGRIFLLQSQLCVLTLIRCPFHPLVTAVARKRLRSFCQKCRWQVTPKHAYTFDPTKLEWADYAAVQA